MTAGLDPDGAHRAPLQKAFLWRTVQPMIAPGGYELILGSSLDQQFGPVLLFGATVRYLVEIFKDRALGLLCPIAHWRDV